MSIVSAHIDTYGERASDVFYVQRRRRRPDRRHRAASSRCATSSKPCCAPPSPPRPPIRPRRRWLWRAPRRRAEAALARLAARLVGASHEPCPQHRRHRRPDPGVAPVRLRARLAAGGGARRRAGRRRVLRRAALPQPVPPARSPKARSARRSCRSIPRRWPQQGEEAADTLAADALAVLLLATGVLSAIAIAGDAVDQPRAVRRLHRRSGRHSSWRRC